MSELDRSPLATRRPSTVQTERNLGRQVSLVAGVDTAAASAAAIFAITNFFSELELSVVVVILDVFIFLTEASQLIVVSGRITQPLRCLAKFEFHNSRPLQCGVASQIRR